MLSLWRPILGRRSHTHSQATQTSFRLIRHPPPVLPFLSSGDAGQDKENSASASMVRPSTPNPLNPLNPQTLPSAAARPPTRARSRELHCLANFNKHDLSFAPKKAPIKSWKPKRHKSDEAIAGSSADQSAAGFESRTHNPPKIFVAVKDSAADGMLQFKSGQLIHVRFTPEGGLWVRSPPSPSASPRRTASPLVSFMPPWAHRNSSLFPPPKWPSQREAHARSL